MACIVAKNDTMNLNPGIKGYIANLLPNINRFFIP